jgi:thiol:disulfide interchange protein DsbC
MWWTEFKYVVTGAVLIVISSLAMAQAHADPAAPTREPVDIATVEDAKQKLGATFKNFQFEKMEQSPIPGLIEIYASGRIIYYAPGQEILLMGEMYSANGVSLTEERINAFASEKVVEIDRSAALAVGNGPKEVIEFVDPDCGHCRAAYRWFTTEKRADVRHLIYFMPLKGRPQAEARVLELLCAKPEAREAALARVFNPGAPLDLQQAVRCKEGVEQLAAQAKVAQQIGVYATPFFVINGKVTAGFNAETLAAQLGEITPTVSQIER